ncbi:unnamed protein product [Darwinula stevensoni]|uniref:PDZ domain-containing protein n=1 Tax=Darwinula stevensoni TaxID=69355 RepID=A0A7R9A752_9CRUS|nr:unnamed protein product [Darwinula stevensoni]CAG0891564.1 unnamed protein product [Darwinula stevensoni]
MAATTTETGHAAFQHVFQNLDQLNGRVGATDTEALFLKGLMDSPVLKSLVKVQDRLEEKNGVPSPHPTTASSFQISSEVDELCSKVSSKEAKELGKILKKPHLQSLLKTQDTIARKQYDEDEVDSDHGFKMAPVELPPLQSDTDSIQETYRMVGLRKLPSEPLGITVRSENGNLVIARILGGGMIDRQGLLSVGDVIKEVNGTPVSTAEELTARVQEASDTVVLKLMPSFADAGTGSQVMPAYTDPMHAVVSCVFVSLITYFDLGYYYCTVMI